MNNKIIPSASVIGATVQKLTVNGFTTLVVDDRTAAKEKVLEMIPPNSEVFTMTSVTLEEIGIAKEINESKDFISVRNKLYGSDKKENNRVAQQMGAAPEYAIGSVHAVTEDGKLMIVSNTGSQLPAYAYGADHVVLVIGAQKIVKNIDEGMKRIYDYVLPLESDRAHKAYGVPGSNISKLLIINKEIKPNRITILLVKEILGF